MPVTDNYFSDMISDIEPVVPLSQSKIPSTVYEAKFDGEVGKILPEYEGIKRPGHDNAIHPTHFEEINLRRENSLGLIDLMESIQSPSTHTFGESSVPYQYENESIMLSPQELHNSNKDKYSERKPNFHLGSTETIFDKIHVPGEFVGDTFEEMFLSMVRGIKVIPIAIYRRHLKPVGTASDQSKTATTDEMPFVIVIPGRDTILMNDDELFILR